MTTFIDLANQIAKAKGLAAEVLENWPAEVDARGELEHAVSQLGYVESQLDNWADDFDRMLARDLGASR